MTSWKNSGTIWQLLYIFLFVCIGGGCRNFSKGGVGVCSTIDQRRGGGGGPQGVPADFCRNSLVKIKIFVGKGGVPTPDPPPPFLDPPLCMYFIMFWKNLIILCVLFYLFFHIFLLQEPIQGSAQCHLDLSTFKFTVCLIKDDFFKYFEKCNIFLS